MKDSVVDVGIGKISEHEVCLISGKTVYVEALSQGQWLGRGWGMAFKVTYFTANPLI